MAEKKTEKIGTFEGRTITHVNIIVQKTGDGLSKAMTVEPTILKQGDEGYVVMAFKTTKIRFDSVKDEPRSAVRVQILEATGATFADPDLVKKIVDEMTERIAEKAEADKIAAEEARG